MSKRTRQYIGIIAAIVAYYLVHGGAYLLYALFTGVFRQIKFMGLGVQVDVFRERMTDTQLGIFCLVGALSTFCTAYLLIALAKKIGNAESKLFRAVFYYTTSKNACSQGHFCAVRQLCSCTKRREAKPEGLRSKTSCTYYITIALLLIDPLYLSVLCGLFGGGDMNGIALLVPEWAARAAFGALLIVNGLVFRKRVLSVCEKSFSNTEVQA